MYRKAMQVNSLYSYPYLNQQKPLVLPVIAYTLFNKIGDKGKIVSAWYRGGREGERGGGGKGGDWGKEGEMTQTLYAPMNKRYLKKSPS
jgi:hypothetical protein